MSDLTAIKPLRIGVRFKQPAIVLMYEQCFKYRKRVMPIRNLKKTSCVTLACSDLKDRHAKFLVDVPSLQIEKMLRLVQNDMKGLDLDENLRDIEKEFSVDPEEDLNGADDDRLQRKKEIMDMVFEKNRKKPGDPDFQYDVEVDFTPVAGMETSVWDSDKDGDDEF